jgi:hypothetical protein
MKKDILVILSCLCFGLIITGCAGRLTGFVTKAFLAQEAIEITTKAVTNAILPHKEGKSEEAKPEGIGLGMTRTEVKNFIEKSEFLTLIYSTEEKDGVTTTMWDFETWIYFFYHKGKLFKITYGTVMVSEDLIETDLRKQFENYYHNLCQEFGDPYYSREKDFLLTVSEFGELPDILVYAWIEKNAEMRLWLHHETESNDLTKVKYRVFVTVWDSKVIKKTLKEGIEE